MLSSLSLEGTTSRIVVVYFQRQHKMKYIIIKQFHTTQFAKHNINIIKFVLERGCEQKCNITNLWFIPNQTLLFINKLMQI